MGTSLCSESDTDLKKSVVPHNSTAPLVVKCDVEKYQLVDMFWIFPMSSIKFVPMHC